MAKARADVAARNFFLNEQHELTRGEHGGGRMPLYANINWRAKGENIRTSLGKVRQTLARSVDPLKEDRFFVLAAPDRRLFKKSGDVKRAPEGRVEYAVNYAAKDSKIFSRLGLDLIDVHKDGTATVHLRSDKFDQIVASTAILDQLGGREQVRWAMIDHFGVVPANYRVDAEWLASLSERTTTEAIIELQPLLNAREVEQVARGLVAQLPRSREERILGVGTDFSGRHWLRARLRRDSLQKIADAFFSVQTLHPPLFSVTVAQPARRSRPAAMPRQVATASRDVTDLPCVAVVDTGVPADHLLLSPYRRGQFIDPDSAGQAMGDHGSLVASRIVFGDQDFDQGIPAEALIGDCSFHDVNVAASSESIVEKSVTRALEAVIGGAPDVRVFNLSFDNVRALDLESDIDRAEKLRLVQDLDNLVFARDVVIVLAGGNSRKGAIPATRYPRHFDDPAWGMGSWPRSFNSITCGSTSNRLNPLGVAQEIGAPSPFARVGPGTCGSPKPDFCAPGGNSTAKYDFRAGLGVWACSSAGLWEDRPGSSFAAPILAREAAFAMRLLQREACAPGARPYAALVKAFLALTTTPPELSAPLQTLASRTLGRGSASAERLSQARPDSAVIAWQGLLQGSDDLARVQIPIPRDWLTRSENPRLRLVVAWDSPVNAAVEEIWACRKVFARLHVALGSSSLRGSQSSHKSYPIIDRTYDLTRLPQGAVVEEDTWVVEIGYQEIAEYVATQDFTPEQRVGLVAELVDDSDNRVSPQAALQALPQAATMTRLSVAPVSIRNAVVIKTRA